MGASTGGGGQLWTIWERIVTTPAVRPHRSRYKVKRNIYFYRPDAGASEHGRREIDFSSLLGKLDALDFSRAPNGRYAVQDNGDLLCAWVDQAENIGRMRFGLVRKNALPQSELGGKLKDLRLAEDEGICETAHLCFFPESIIGVEFNYFGPRVQRLPQYLSRVVRADKFAMEALLRDDMAEQLGRKMALRRLTLRVRRSYIAQIAEADKSLGDALAAAERVSDAECIGIILEPEPYQRVNLHERLLSAVRNLVSLPEMRSNVRQLEVDAVGDDATGTTTLNLLEDKLIKKTTILRNGQRSRALNSEDAYSKIEEAFSTMRQDLLSASSVSVEGE